MSIIYVHKYSDGNVLKIENEYSDVVDRIVPILKFFINTPQGQKRVEVLLHDAEGDKDLVLPLVRSLGKYLNGLKEIEEQKKEMAETLAAEKENAKETK